MKRLGQGTLTISLSIVATLFAACAALSPAPAAPTPASRAATAVPATQAAPSATPVPPTEIASTVVASAPTLISPTATAPAPTSTPPPPTALPTTLPGTNGVIPLSEGVVAFVRVEKETTSPDSDATPSGEVVELRFGDQVTLEKKSDDLPMWLVSKDGKSGWVSAAKLTANTAEIEFLRKENRIPTSTSLIFASADGVVRVSGLMIMTMSINSAGGGTAGAPGSSASSQFASEGNAVFLDESVTNMSPPIMTMACGAKTYKLRDDTMYYCTGVDNKGEGCFECLDLATLSKCAD